MSLSPQARLKELEERLSEKEAEKRKLAEAEEKTAAEIEEAKEQLAAELEELRREVEVKELSERIAILESQGRSDDAIVAELRKRGVDPSRIRSALEQHAEEHPHHDHDHGQSLEEIAASAPKTAESGPAGSIYDVAEQMRGANSFYEMASRDTYQRLQSLQESVQGRGLTNNEYRQLNEMQEELSQRQQGYDDSFAYARREIALIDKIKEAAGVQGQSAYERSFGKRGF